MDRKLLEDVRILVVDDNDQVRDVLQRMLQMSGATCATAPSAAEARSLLATTVFDVVITDMNMPGESGLEVVRAAAEKQADTAVLVLSGADDPELAVELIELGVFGYLTKPPRPNEVVISIRGALDRRSARIASRAAREESERDLQRETVLRLVSAAELRDDETGEHIIRMSEYVAIIARAFGFSEERVEMLRLASPMHDLGKIGVPDSVLRKPGPLTLEERQTMQLHAEIGHQILANSDSALLRLGALLALTHHERYDGTGYPHGLAGEEIPIEGRIAAVADVFDALTSDRAYRRALSTEEALDLMRGERGYQFDPDVLDAFLSVLDQVLAAHGAGQALHARHAA